MLMVTFHPQAWIDDQAVAVDPEGETAFTVSEVEARSLTRYEGAWGDFEADTFDGDNLVRAKTAPEWIRGWTGPFYVGVEELEGPEQPLEGATESAAPETHTLVVVVGRIPFEDEDTRVQPALVE